MWSSVKCVPCHHGIARPQVADGGDGLQIWRVDANILNKQPRAADKGWSSSLAVGRGLTTPIVKRHHIMKCFYGLGLVLGVDGRIILNGS
jgi:hypothetical protein